MWNVSWPLQVVRRQKGDWRLSRVLCDMAAITFDPNFRVSLGERSLLVDWEVVVCKCEMRNKNKIKNIQKLLAWGWWCARIWCWGSVRVVPKICWHECGIGCNSTRADAEMIGVYYLWGWGLLPINGCLEINVSWDPGLVLITQHFCNSCLTKANTMSRWGLNQISDVVCTVWTTSDNQELDPRVSLHRVCYQ